jgi:hypothetical protein
MTFPTQGAPPPEPPWHMWGSGVLIHGVQVAGGNTLTSAQVARANYRRPDTWRFWLGARLIGGTPNTGGAANYYRVNFTLQLGVGRSIFVTPAPPRVGIAYTDQFFAQFRFEVLVGETPGNQGDNIKWATSVRTPLINDGDATSWTLVDHLVAQDIQCQATLHMESAPVGYQVDAEATAFFAPNVHLRPDWSVDGPDTLAFRGGELGGS